MHAPVPTVGGASTLSPLPTGGRRRGTRKMSKKVKAMLKKMKLMGGVMDPKTGEEGGRRRRRRTRRHRRRHAGMFA